ncbi:MAG: S1 family serine peptidase [Thermoleophilaceae bacterium]
MRRVGIAIAAGVCALLGASPAGAVVGGKPAPPGSFPYVADVFIAGSFGCTGTLIAPQWVLTAGHCGSLTGSLSEGLVPTPVSWPANQYEIQLGSVYASGTGGEQHSVTEVDVDTDYLPTNGTGNDVSLLKLDKPTALPPMKIAATAERSSWAPGTLATIAGFGTTSQDAADAPSQMQFAQVPITTDAYCAQAYPGGLSELPDDGSFDATTMLCAGYPQGGTDTCQGDSGGPLLVALPSGTLRLAGATSFGNGCAQPGKPGVYARLAEGPIRTFIERFVPDAFGSPEPAGAGSQTAPHSAPTPKRKSTAKSHKQKHHHKKKHKHHKKKRKHHRAKKHRRR